MCSEKVNKHHRSFHSFTTEHVSAALIRLELTILVIMEIINTLMPNQYQVSNNLAKVSYSQPYILDDPQLQEYYNITKSERGSQLV